MLVGEVPDRGRGHRDAEVPAELEPAGVGAVAIGEHRDRQFAQLLLEC